MHVHQSSSVEQHIPPGYTLREHGVLFRSANSLVLRCTNNETHQNVIVKVVNKDVPLRSQIALLERDFEITQLLSTSIPPEYILQVYSKLYMDNSLALIKEDFNAIDLQQFVLNQPQKRLSLDLFFKIALHIAKVLSMVHNMRVLHLDMKPHNILINYETYTIKLSDFAISQIVSLKRPYILREEGSALGSFKFMSPEQTGRFAQAIDRRSDIYSLGATFYFMITGIPPFPSNIASELVFCHMAKEPLDIHLILNDKSFPKAIEYMISKMMAKSVNDRYQSVHGIIKDLNYIQQTLAKGNSLSNFVPSVTDSHGIFFIPPILFGREKEIASLEHVMRKSKEISQMLLLKGPAGIGKNAIVEEFLRLYSYELLCAYGKHEPVVKNKPHVALSSCLSHLVTRLLGEGKEMLHEITSEMIESLQSNVALLVELAPSLELILGSPSKPSFAALTDETERMIATLTTFFRILTKDTSKILCLHIDDCQWSDICSLHFLHRLIGIPGLKLMIILSYKDNDIPQDNPVGHYLSQIATQRHTTIIEVPPIAQSALIMLLSEILQLNNVQELAHIVLQRTKGNPFFIREFLLNLYHQEMLWFDFSEEKWKWSIEKIRQMESSENVVSMEIQSLQSYSKKTQDILATASCIGYVFSLKDLCSFFDESEEQITFDLKEALTEGWILELPNKGFKFLHDKLQHAAYNLLSEHERKDIHFRIGKIKLRTVKDRFELQEQIFDIVNHLSNKLDYILLHQQERKELLNLAIIAAKKAIQTSAFDVAIHYTELGLKLLPPQNERWNAQNYNHSMDIYLIHLQAQNLTKNFENAIVFGNSMLANVHYDSERFVVYRIVIDCHNAMGQFEESFSILEKVMKNCREMLYSIPIEKDRELDQWIEEHLPKVKKMVKEAIAEDWKNVPVAHDEKMKSLLSMLSMSGSPAFYMSVSSNKKKFCAFSLCLLELVMNYGFSEYSTVALGIASLGYFIMTNDINNAFMLAQKSLYLTTITFPSESLKSISLVFYAMLFPRHCTLYESSLCFESAFLSCSQIGESTYGGYAGIFAIITGILSGRNLHDLTKFYDAVHIYSIQTKSELVIQLIYLLRQLMAGLRGETDEFQDSLFLAKTSSRFFKFCYWFCRGLFFLFTEKYDVAFTSMLNASELLDNVVTTPFQWLFPFYIALTSSIGLDFHPHIIRRDQMIETFYKWKEKADEYNTKFDKYMKASSPLLDAERMKIEKDQFDSASILNCYDQASSISKNISSMLVNAICYQRVLTLTEQLSLHQGFRASAATEAIHAWCIIRAHGLAHRLIERHSKLLEFAQISIPEMSQMEHSFSSKADTSSADGNATNATLQPEEDLSPVGEQRIQNLEFSTDQQTLLKMSNASTSPEVDLLQLFVHMLPVILQNTSAERCVLVLRETPETPFQIRAQIVANVRDTVHNANEGENAIQLPLSAVQLMSLDLKAAEKIICTQIVNVVLRSRIIVIADCAFEDKDYRDIPYIKDNQIQSVLCTPIIYNYKLCGAIYLENNKIDTVFTKQRSKILNTIIDVSIQNAKLFTHLTYSYARFLPKEFLQQLGKENVTKIETSDYVERDMTVLFSDIRNFTRITEKMSARHAFMFVNQFFAQVAPIVDRNQGFIDKFIGDAIMALFTGPCSSALRSSIKMIDALDDLNRNKPENEKIYIGIGIHYGRVILGTVGYSKRLSATVISDTVNTSARLESLTKAFGLNIIVTSAVIDQLMREWREHSLHPVDLPDHSNPQIGTDSFKYRRIGCFLLEGKQVPYDIYEVYADHLLHEQSIANFPDALQTFDKAVQAFTSSKFEKANTLFNSIATKFPNDQLIALYLEATLLYQNRADLPASWRGEIQLTKEGKLFQNESSLQEELTRLRVENRLLKRKLQNGAIH